MHDSVRAMIADPQAPTAPLDEFWEDFRADDNLWWTVPTGHHLNLFEAAMELIELDDDFINVVLPRLARR